MANSFITVKEIARQTLPRLIENLVFPNLIHKDFSKEFIAGKGAKVQVKKPVILKAEEFDENKGTTPQDVNEQSVTVTLDKLATVDIELGAIESVTSVDDLNRIFITPAAEALAQKINSDGLELYKDIPYVCGTAGTTPSALTDLSEARKALNINRVPTAGRVAVWDPEADAKFATIDAIVNAEKSGSTSALREGSIGRVFGLDNYMSQAVKTHTKGTLSGTPKAEAATKEGATSLTLTATALTGTLVKGDILTILGDTYTIKADATAADNKITVDIYPALKKDITTATVISLTDSHTANLAFNPSAFAFVTRPLTIPAGVESYVTSYDGITLRIVKGYNMTKKKNMLSMDVLYGYQTMYEELAVRVLG